MRKLYTLLFLLPFAVAVGQVEGTWKLAPQAAALGVGPGLGDISWWSNSQADVTTRACLFDDEFVFEDDGTFMNVMGDETWLEPWQGSNPEGCGAPVAPHDGSNAATWSYDEGAGTLTLTGVGAHLGLPKAYNGGELGDPADAPESVTYNVEFADNGNTMNINIEIQGGAYWHFVFAKEQGGSNEGISGQWILAPIVAAMGVGPGLGDISWWSTSEDDLEIRACHFDDIYDLKADGSFMNIQGDETWLEGWQGVEQDGCGAPVAPHDGSNPATWTYDEEGGELTLNGVGAYIGLAKVYNGGELQSPDDAVESITYPVTMSANGDTMEINIEIQGGAYWRFILVRYNPSSIFETSLSQTNVYPNPATDFLYLENARDLVDVKVYSVTGQMIYQAEAVDNAINVGNFPPGMYTLRANGLDGKQYYARFMVR